MSRTVGDPLPSHSMYIIRPPPMSTRLAKDSACDVVESRAAIICGGARQTAGAPVVVKRITAANSSSRLTILTPEILSARAWLLAELWRNRGTSLSEINNPMKSLILPDVTFVTPSIHLLLQRREIAAVGLVMSISSRRVRLLFGFEPKDWLFLAGGITLTAVVAAVLEKGRPSASSGLCIQRLAILRGVRRVGAGGRSQGYARIQAAGGFYSVDKY